MNDSIRISVIIPAYNAAAFLPGTVDSVLKQDFTGIEIILVNDGSTDSTPEVCADLERKDDRIRVINKDNGGVSSARNAGLDAASGEYVMFIDADDAISSDALERMYHPDVDFVLGGFEKIREASVIESYVPSVEVVASGEEGLSGFMDEVISDKHCYLMNSACFKLFRRSIIVENRIRFEEGLSYAEDKLFVMTYMCYVNKVMTVPEIVYSYFLQEGSLSSDMTSDRHLRQVLKLLDGYAPLITVLRQKFPFSTRTGSLYHDDLVGRYVCRILTVFFKRPSDLMSEQTLEYLYGLMDKDSRLGLFSIRVGQVVNIALYKIRNIRFSVAFYRMSSYLFSWISRNDKRQAG